MNASALNLSTKIKLAYLFCVTAVMISIMGSAIFLFERASHKDLQEHLNMSMALGWEMIRDLGTPLQIIDGELYAGSVKLDGRNRLVDEITEISGAKATIFKGDVRVATSVQNEKGERVIGTHLAMNEAHKAVFEGRPYRGDADILGVGYVTGYDPIFDKDKNVTGVLFVGVPKSVYYRNLLHSLTGMFVVGISVTIILGFFGLTFIQKTVRTLSRSFESDLSCLIDDITKTSSNLCRNSAEVMESMHRTGERNEEVGESAKTATVNVQAVAGATDQLNSASRQIGDELEKAGRMARSANDAASRTTQTVDTLAEAGQKIGEVVSLIEQIAGQTNLLALNATIEASRAGEAGKGFAVVANEVKVLANKTAEATDNIRNQINAIQTETHSTVSAIREITGDISEINRVSSGITATVQQQISATSEISDNIRYAADGTNKISSHIRDVSDLIRTTNAKAERIMDESDALIAKTDAMRKEIGVFLKALQ